eukprot:COSAG02_NODE_42995_length_379_cov_0.735714_1_plen_41_part_01
MRSIASIASIARLLQSTCDNLSDSSASWSPLGPSDRDEGVR